MTASVGPVLEATAAGRAVVAAIRELNRDVEVQDRGSYLRVRAVGRCTVSREAIERILGQTFRLPSDLESIMPSFSGTLRVSEDEASWTPESHGG